MLSLFFRLLYTCVIHEVEHVQRNKTMLLLQTYSRGAERIRTQSISGRLSPLPSEVKDLQLSSVQPETVVEQTSAAADDSPDHQILMAPRNPKLSVGTDNVITESNSENGSIGTKKDD